MGEELEYSNEIKQKCLNILREIDRICKKEGITYYIYAGTLLGAVRHHGFIPWDDDIDVVMFREDYNRFAEACMRELDQKIFELQTIYTDSQTSNPWMKLHDKNTAFISGIRRQGTIEGINVDIFPIDNAPDSDWRCRLRGKIIDKINFIYQFRFCRRFEEASFKMKIFQTLIRYIPPFKEQGFKEKYDRYLQKYNCQKTKRVVYLSNRTYRRKLAAREWFAEPVMLRFEGEFFPAPRQWEKVLIALYGENYMKLPPENQRVTVHGTRLIDTERSWREYIDIQGN